MASKSHRNAFTIIELLIVVVIIAVVAALVFVSYSTLSSKASVASISIDLENNAKKLKLYNAEFGSYPTSIDGNGCPTAPKVSTEAVYCLKYSSGNSLSSYSGDIDTFNLKIKNNSTTYLITESTTVKPDIIRDGLALNLDLTNPQTMPNATQLVPDSEFSGATRLFNNGPAYTSPYHVGEIALGEMTGNSVNISGGDAANYYGSVWQSVDTGDLGTTGGNWRYYNIFPATTDSTKNYIVDIKWRFKYISKKGIGTKNPSMQFGNGYTAFYTKYFNSAGYSWQKDRLYVKGSSINRTELTFACNSADSAVEIDYLRVYQLDNLSGSMAINLSEPAGVGNFAFDGIDDYAKYPNPIGNFSSNNFNISMWINPSNQQSILVNPYGNGLDNFVRYLPTTKQINVHVCQAADTVETDFNSSVNSVPLDKWTYVSINLYGSNVDIYINGVLDSKNSRPESVAPWTNDWYIGNRANLTNWYLGKISSVFVYNRTLSEQEISQNYNALRSSYGL